MSGKNKLISVIFVVLALLIGFAISLFRQNSPSTPPAPINPIVGHVKDELSVHFVDVGQADCQIVLLPTGQTMVIDAGNNDDGDLICDYLKALGITNIDYLIGTHPHEDHIGSMDTVINNFTVKQVYMPDAEADSVTYRDVITAIDDAGLEVTYTKSNMLIYSDDTLTIQTVAPVYDYDDDLNNQSIVLRVTYKEASFLFTGDAEEESENDITLEIGADVLSVGHHGSSTSTSDSFLKRVDPMFAVISCGKNNEYGHPHTETLEKLTNDDVTVYRTDTMGTIICRTKGAKGDYKWETVK